MEHEGTGMNDQPRVEIDYFSDLLCIWAHVAQVRVDELASNFGDQVHVHCRYFNLFGDTRHKIGAGWAERGGYDAFARHLREVGERFDHIALHPALWREIRPASSAGAHLALKAAQVIGGDTGRATLADDYARALRLAFFRDAREIGHWQVQAAVAREVGLDPRELATAIGSSRAHAALAADERDRLRYRVEGSPTFVLNEGRQVLFGNLGYRVLEANVRELLREPTAGAASWC
jgi:predicted DsbA family dithiol-disulfide isomerase